ncbi:MAG: ABC transporter permease [Thermoguttaceae bacterium]|nr:ABC transporter permease [Thermoguttaceae bacterium]
MNRFRQSLSRILAIFMKETIQLRRDRVTFIMIISIPVFQLVLFGYVINNDPRHLPTAVLVGDESRFTRTILSSLRNSEYFDLTERFTSHESAETAMMRGDILFIITIPPNFSRDILRGETPSILVEADATDSVTVGGAIAALNQLPQQLALKDFEGILGQNNSGISSRLSSSAAPLTESSVHSSSSQPISFEVRVHRKYNPEVITQYNIVPGLIGVILTLTLVMLTALAITRERERGTMENLLSMPATPLETLYGKITPYILIGLLQVTFILVIAIPLFKIPFEGKLWELYLSAFLLILANLTVGVLISSVARSQLQAMQMTIFWFLPNILLTGFMFPIAGMPIWAQWISRIIPLTYFHHLMRGILLKGMTGAELWHDLWPILLFTTLTMFVAVRTYRRTLD